MSSLILPSRQIWTQQPQGNAQINKGHPDARGLVDAAYAGQCDWLTPGSAAKRTVTGSGVALQGDGGAGYFYRNSAPAVNLTASMTMFAVVLGATGADTRLFSYGNSSSDAPFISVASGSTDSSKLRLFIRDSANYYDTPLETAAPVFEAARAHAVAITLGGGVAKAYVDGQPDVQNSTVGFSSTTFDRTAVGCLLRAAAVSFSSAALILGLTFNRALSQAEIKALSDNPWRLFKRPDRRIWIPAGAGAGASLSGNAQASASASGALTLSASLTGAALAVASASGSLSTGIPLDGHAFSAALASGSLTAQVRLDGAALAQAAAAAGLGAQIRLAGDAHGQASASGTLAADPASLAGNAQAQATVVATLTTQIQLSGSAAAQAGMSGLLTTAIPLTAAALAQVIASGLLTVPILLVGNAVAHASASGLLSSLAPASAMVPSRLTAQVTRLTRATAAVARLTTITHEVSHV